MNIVDWRFDHLLELLRAQARTRREAERRAEIIVILSQALPADLVALAYRITDRAA